MAGIYTARVGESAEGRIGPYERRTVRIQPWDPAVVEVASRVAAIINARRPELRIEHIGSTSVPGLPGKGIVDLGTEADPAEIPAITEAMYEIGFGPQPGSDPWPPTRPMHVGSIVHAGTEYRIHFHVHPVGGDLAQDLRFRDSLRADPELAASYGRIKEAIADGAGGALEGPDYQGAKGGWIVETYDRLGIPRPSTPSTSTTRPSEDARP
jgi:dephospho-CoA kinase